MNKTNIHLKRINITGFKSIKHLDFEFGPVNILIGANGAGKSNLLKYFSFIRALENKKIKHYAEQSGGAAGLLFGGPKRTSTIETKIFLESPSEIIELIRKAGFVPPDSLGGGGIHNRITSRSISETSKEKDEIGDNSKLKIINDSESPWEDVKHFIDSLKVYHFADTTYTAAIRRSCYLHDNKSIHADGKNLAAILYRILRQNKICYSRIIETIRQICPWFGDFVLQPLVDDLKRVQLDWQEAYSEEIFGPHILPDGALRAIALIAILLQPWEELPPLLIIDEPELGLHPHALVVIASLMNQASHHCQLIVGTQSTFFLDQFEPKDIIIVEREEGASTFKRLEEDKLHDWLAEYSLSELWEKNVIGGGPF